MGVKGMIPSSPSSLTNNTNQCPTTPPKVMPHSTSATTLVSLGLMTVLLHLTNVSSTPIPTSGEGLPVLGDMSETAGLHIPPLSISYNAPVPTSLLMKPLMISVCEIWCGLMPSPPTIDLTTTTSVVSLLSQASSEEVLETGKPMKEGILDRKSVV